MARPFHVHLPHLRQRPGERLLHPDAALLLILLLAAFAALWIYAPPVAALLPTHPPG